MDSLRAAEPSLQSIEDVLQAIINVMNVVALSFLEVKKDDELETILRGVLYTSFAARSEHVRENSSTPSVTVSLVSGKRGYYCAPRFCHRMRIFHRHDQAVKRKAV